MRALYLSVFEQPAKRVFLSILLSFAPRDRQMESVHFRSSFIKQEEEYPAGFCGFGKGISRKSRRPV
jgi:hypothetical protein